MPVIKMRQFGKLSPRQLECLRWAAYGKTYKDIGEILGLGFGAVKTHLDTARLKLGAVNLPNAIFIAMNKGLFDDVIIEFENDDDKVEEIIN